jgi:ribosomal protein S25
MSDLLTMARNLVYDTAKHADKTRYRNTDPVTSKEAAEQVDHELQMNRVLSGLRAATANRTVVTSAELANIMGVDRYITARRLPDLKKQGLVAQCGKAVCLINRTQAVTWRSLC